MDGPLDVSRGASASEATFECSDADSPWASGVDVTAVSTHGRRLTDTPLPVHDPHRLLAFVEQQGDVFEVMQLGVGFEWHELGSLDAAVEFVIASGPALARGRLSGELSTRC